MRVPDRDSKIEKKLFVTIDPVNSYIVWLPYHIWLQFIYQPQSDYGIFVIVTIDI